MGPYENPTNRAERRKRLACRPRPRRCLLKGCEQRFAPQQVRQRYCSEHCREAARKWARWKAQRTYRGTMAGKEKRNDQSRRYRERVRSRETPEPEAVGEPARVITKNVFKIVATGPAAMRDSCASGEVLCNASVHTRAGVRWNAFKREWRCAIGGRVRWRDPRKGARRRESEQGHRARFTAREARPRHCQGAGCRAVGLGRPVVAGLGRTRSRADHA